MMCVSVREVAETLGIQYRSAHKLLRRLEDRGLLKKKFVGRVAMYCGDKQLVESLLMKRRNRKVKGVERMAATRVLLQREGCVSTYTVRMALDVRTEIAVYTMRQLAEEGEAVEVVIGRTAIWCRSQREAESIVEQLRNVVHRLALSNNMRYATPTKVLRAVQGNREAYTLFSKLIPINRIDKYFNPVALAFADGILQLLYGEPILRGKRKTVYVVTQPRELVIDVREHVDKKMVSINLPDDIVSVLRGADVNETVLQAIEQLLQKYRT